MRTVIVTGATRGIGQAIAEKYKQQGWHVIGTGNSDQNLDYLDEYFVCDFTKESRIESLCSELENVQVDVLINNAGINRINAFAEMNPRDFLDIQLVNVYAPFRLCQTVIPYMAKQQWGRIVNISSVWGQRSRTGRAAYSASKFAIDGMTVSLADEYTSQGILANCVSPGFIDTDMTRKNLGPAGIEKILERVPAKRLAQTTEIAEVVYWLGSDSNTFISGQNIAADGGFIRA